MDYRAYSRTPFLNQEGHRLKSSKFNGGESGVIVQPGAGQPVEYRDQKK